ncbi:MAG TPA: phosphoglycerate kinase [Deltaproteobacteria bacterium]|nr:MAG: phosphoglycerate kinase [Deltaproteobacteria bacterium GWC2_65_14]HBO68993.1 phosphoglycerate kinase [Deltaproteobacteria bacterium]
MKIRTIDQMDLTGKRTLIRVDFNVPLDKAGAVTDDTRIQAVLPTLRTAAEKGAVILLLSHLGRPKGKTVPEMSLAPVAPRLASLLGKGVRFVPDCVGEAVEKAAASARPGEILLLENVRFHPGEEKNDEAFGRQLAALCDVYVNDAFATAHRGHASNVAVTRFVREKAAGLLLKNEIAFFEKALVSPARPLAAVFGGAKISGKIQAIHNVLGKVDKILIGGAMANTFIAAQGFPVGKSLYEAEMTATAKQVLAEAEGRKVRLYLPVDVVVADRLDASAATKAVPVQEIPDGWLAADVGPATSILFREALQDAKTIVWNGPMGAFELAPFAAGTFALMRALAESDATTIVGGGDTDTALHKAGLFSRMSYVSTGGGAFLELLEGKRLPGIVALEEA